MNCNPKVSAKIWIPTLLIVIAFGFYMQGAPRRSLDASSEWLNRHKAEWHELKGANPALERIELMISTEKRGTVLAFGHTYDQSALELVDRFVETRYPPNRHYRNKVELITKTAYDLMFNDDSPSDD